MMLPQLELIAVRFAYTWTLKPIISMISGLLDASPAPKTNYFIFGDTRTPKQIKKCPGIF